MENKKIDEIKIDDAYKKGVIRGVAVTLAKDNDPNCYLEQAEEIVNINYSTTIDLNSIFNLAFEHGKNYGPILIDAYNRQQQINSIIDFINTHDRDLIEYQLKKM